MFNFIRKAPVSKKLLMISLTYSLPIAVMAYLIVTGINKDIQFSTMELHGNTYQRPLEQLLKAVQKHEYLAVDAARGSKEAQAAIATEQTAVEKGLDALDTADRSLGVVLQFTDEGLALRNRSTARASNLRSQWVALKAQLATLKPDAIESQHRDIVATIRTMIAHSGDISNLILDPDLDTYYLMDATLLALPQTQDRLGAMVIWGTDALNDKAVTSTEHVHFAVQAALLREADLDRIAASIHTAFKEDANFYGSNPTLQTNIEPALESYLATTKAFIEMTERITASDNAPCTPAEYAAAGQKAIDASFHLWQSTVTEMDTMLTTRVDQYRHERTWALVLSGVALLIASAFVMYLMRTISRPLSVVVEMLNGNAQQVASASGQLASASQSLAQGASEQAASLEETGGSLKEMSAMTRKSADTTQQTRSLSAEAQSAATRGNEAMGRMSVAINQIQKSASETGKIIKVIDEIAFQTNLLALNAAVEAARAGEAGKGFAVVAEEVRNLAMRSAEAARNTAAMIEQSVQSAQGGMQIVGDVGKVLEEITASSTRVNHLVTEIAAAGQEQALGIEQVNSAVSQMDKVTQSNAASAEETAAAGEQLASQAEQLSGVVQELTKLVGGAAKRLTQKKRSSGRSTAPRVASVSVQASKLIPFDDNQDESNDRDFSEFNKAA